MRFAILALAIPGMFSLAYADPVSAALPVALFLGDSHSVGTFGRRTDENLRDSNQVRVATYGSCGSSPSWWFSGQPTQCGFFQRGLDGTLSTGLKAPTPRIEALLATLHPTVTFVALGANLVQAPEQHAFDTSRQLAEKIVASGSRCIWIGPPHGRNKPEPAFSHFYEILQSAVGPSCDFIDSRPFAHYPDTGGDGIHYDHLGPAGREIARKWADAVFSRASELLGW